MASRREAFQGLNNIPSKNARVETGIKLGLFSLDNIVPASVFPIEKSPIHLTDAFLEKVHLAIDIQPKDVQLPQQIKDLAHLPEDFLVLLESFYAAQVIENVQKRIQSPGFRIRILHLIARENFTVGVHNVQMTVLQQVEEFMITGTYKGFKKNIARLHTEVETSEFYVLNGQSLLERESSQQEEILNYLADFHAKAAHVSGLVGQGLGKLTCYPIKIGGEIIWLAEYWSARAVQAAAKAAARGIKTALEHKTKQTTPSSPKVSGYFVPQ